MSEKIHVLMAEDEAALGHIIKESLETRNFVVNLVQDGEKALEVYHKQPPQVLVLDVMMPRRDGFSVAKEIRQLDA